MVTDTVGVPLSGPPLEVLNFDYEYPVARSRLKRFIDLALGTLLLVASFPAWIVIALAITLESGTPILFAQERVGLHGRVFTIYKFRTMVRNAESLKENLRDKNEAPFPAFKLRADPRCTRVGGFLRKSSLDELPQLLNVLAGQMSLVGPRPPLPEEVQHYDAICVRRLSARPGLTCDWQIADRHDGNSTFDQWVAMDIDYITKWNLTRDLVLLAKTVRAVARMSGT